MLEKVQKTFHDIKCTFFIIEDINHERNLICLLWIQRKGVFETRKVVHVLGFWILNFDHKVEIVLLAKVKEI